MISLFTVMLAMPLQYDVKVLDCYDADTCTIVIETYTTLTVQVIDTKIETGVKIIHGPEKIRMCDIDAPEMRGEEKPRGEISRNALLSWIKEAKTIQFYIAKDIRDKYGRLLGWLFLDHKNANERLIQEGLAIPYIKCKDQNNYWRGPKFKILGLPLFTHTLAARYAATSNILF